jgi:hypothetical protein
VKIGAELGAGASVTGPVISGTNATAGFVPVIGPAIGLEFPGFNPGTASLSLFEMTAIVIPVNGLSLTVTAGGAF